MEKLLNDPKQFELLQRVTEVFLTKGLKVTTMDEVANSLNVSKKTLYKYVNNRPELITKCFEIHVYNNINTINKILDLKLNAIEEQIAIAKHFHNTSKKISPNTAIDAITYFPKAWAIYSNYRQTYVLDIIINNLKKGIEEGLYCKEMNAEIVARIYDNKFVTVFDSKVFPSKTFSMSEVYLSFINHHLRGIATDKGREILDRAPIN